MTGEVGKIPFADMNMGVNGTQENLPCAKATICDSAQFFNRNRSVRCNPQIYSRNAMQVVDLWFGRVIDTRE